MYATRPAGASRAALDVMALALAPGAVAAHPPVFIEGGVDFLFAPQGRIESLRVTWIYDPLNSLFMLEDLGLAPDAAALEPADRARLAAYQTEWVEGFEGDSYLWHDGARVGLSGPLAADAEIRDGQVTIMFRRDVEAPFRPDATTVVQVYDPTYYTAYTVTNTPRLEGAPPGCDAEVVPFEPTRELLQLQLQLVEIPVDGDPDGEPGALFADRVRVACD
jgi:ABC-type uncharacterized transport system substrate-binding protein